MPLCVEYLTHSVHVGKLVCRCGATMWSLHLYLSLIAVKYTVHQIYINFDVFLHVPNVK